MNKLLSRRDFLKLASLLSLSYITPYLFLKPERPLQDPNAKNILIIVFDALSALHMPLYGYTRDTMPNFLRLVNRATIYHNHYAGANFTTPGTASLLTGTYPWTHRAIKIGGEVQEDYASRNIFHLLDEYYRVTYSHNFFVNKLQNQFSSHLDLYTPRDELTFGKNRWITKLFKHDVDIATLSWNQISNLDDGLTNSLFLSHVFQMFPDQITPEMLEAFPRGLPRIAKDIFFLLEDSIDWISSHIQTIPQPFLGYFHLLPPHDPYRTRDDFVDVFLDDGWKPLDKPTHLLFKGKGRRKKTPKNARQLYDEFILYVDSEFHRFFIALEKAGILDNTWIIFTSDHGEMFERGTVGHLTPLLHQPVLRIPLLIFEPGQEKKRDIYANTSAVDLLPTLLHISGNPIPSWVEGEVLPPYRSSNPGDRNIFALEAKNNNPIRPLSTASAMILNGEYKLIYYDGYSKLRGRDYLVELYNVNNDPEELDDLSTSHPGIASDLLAELLTRLEAADEPYQKE
jgi:arylsulfatase A-like enzyme